MIVYAEYPIEQIIPRLAIPDKKDFLTENWREEFIANDLIFMVRVNSQRLRVFTKSITCVSCSIKGKVFRLEERLPSMRPHLNLYAIKNEKYILMTKDHIIPKSKDGRDVMSNYQTMCAPCNSKKGSQDNESIKIFQHGDSKNLPLRRQTTC